jgi:hypothetical protein
MSSVEVRGGRGGMHGGGGVALHDRRRRGKGHTRTRRGGAETDGGSSGPLPSSDGGAGVGVGAEGTWGGRASAFVEAVPWPLFLSLLSQV